jgi:hypothetical protein
LTLLAGDEDHIVLEDLEYSLVAPAGHAGERDLGKPEQLRQISLDPRNDLDLRGQPTPPSASIAATSGRRPSRSNATTQPS